MSGTAPMPRRLEFDLGGHNIPTVTIRVNIDDRTDGGTRMTVEATFPSSDAMDQLASIGFEEGMTTALGQIDDVL